MNETKGHLQQM